VNFVLHTIVSIYEIWTISIQSPTHRVTIGRQLEMFRDAAPQILQKGFRLDWRTSAQDVRNDELAARIKTEEKELIAAKRVIVRVVRFLAPDKAPCFICLDGFGADIADGRIHKPLGLAASPRQHVQDGLLVQSCQAGHGADAQPFGEHIQHCASLFEIHPQIVERLLVRKRRAAFEAFVSLDVEVFVAVKPATFGNSIAAYTVHLTLSGQVLQ